MNICVYIILCVEYAIFQVTSQQCPCTSIQTTKFDLSICDCPRTWPEADQECRAKGALLAEVDNKADENVISGELRKLSVGQAWLGGKMVAGDWRWVQDKSPLYGQGCYKYPTDTSMFTHTETSQQMTQTGCVSTCTQRQQPYAGLYNGDTCLCMTSYNTTTLSSGCTRSCRGNGNQRCGGSNVFSVYATSAVVVGQWKLGYPSSNYPDHMCVKITCEYLPSATWKILTDNCKARHKYLCIYKKDGLCPSNSLQIGTDCYTRSVLVATWYEANHICAQNGGVLADMTSPSIYNTLVTSFSSPIQCFHGSIWLGGSKTLLSWTSGKSITYTNWASAFPSSLSFSTSCIYTTNQYSSQYQWADQQCDLSKAFVCMKGSTLTTTTSTTTRRPTTTATTTTTTTTRPPTTTTTTQPTTTTTTQPTTTTTIQPKTTTSQSTTITKRVSPTVRTTLTQSTTRTTIKPSTPQPSSSPTSTTISSSVKTSSPILSSISGSSTTTKQPAVGISSSSPSSKSTTLRVTPVPVMSTSKKISSKPAYNTTDPAMTAEPEPEWTTAVVAEPEAEMSSADVGGIFLIIVAVIVLTIFFLMSLACCMRPCLKKYFKKRKLNKEVRTDTNPRRAFIRDADFSYMDVSHDGSLTNKGKNGHHTYDKEKSLQRYHSLDIDKGLKKDEMGPKVNMNYLNNQTQTGNSLNTQDGPQQYNIPAQPKGHLDYIDNVGGYPTKDSNLQQKKVQVVSAHVPEDQMPDQGPKKNQVSFEVHEPPAYHSLQKTVIQVTQDKDIVEQPKVEEINNFDNEGFIHEDTFIDASYAHPREYTA